MKTKRWCALALLTTLYSCKLDFGIEPVDEDAGGSLTEASADNAGGVPRLDDIFRPVDAGSDAGRSDFLDAGERVDAEIFRQVDAGSDAGRTDFLDAGERVDAEIF